MDLKDMSSDKLRTLSRDIGRELRARNEQERLDPKRFKATQRNNTSGQKGVTMNKNAGRWQAKISANGKTIHLGYFSDFEAAVAARKAAEAEFWGAES